MDVVVVVVVDAVVVEPALHPFGEILVVVYRSVFPLPQAIAHRGVVGGEEPGIEGGIDVRHPAEMDDVGKLVDEDALSRVGIAVVGEEIFLPAGAIGIGLAAAGTAGPGVPEVAAGDAGKSLHGSGSEEGKLGEIGGVFVVAEDAQPRT